MVYHTGKEGNVYNIGGRNERTNLQIVDAICTILDEKVPLINGCAPSGASSEAKATHPGTVSGCAPSGAPSDVEEVTGEAKATHPKSYKELITFVEDRAGHDRRYAIDATKLENELGWKADENFESGIVKTVEWYLNKYGINK